MAAEPLEEGGLREVKRKRTKPRPKVRIVDVVAADVMFPTS